MLKAKEFSDLVYIFEKLINTAYIKINLSLTKLKDSLIQKT